MRLQYEIKGMSCAACVAHVERAVGRALGRQEGFTVSLLTNSVSVITEELDGQELAALEERLASSVRAAGYVLVILLAEIFNFSLSITGLHSALPFRFPLLKGVLLPVTAILLSVTAVRRLIPISGTVSTVLSVVLTLILYILLLAASLSILGKKTAKSEVSPRRPLDNTDTFGYKKRERDVAPWGKKE